MGKNQEMSTKKDGVIIKALNPGHNTSCENKRQDFLVGSPLSLLLNPLPLHRIS